MEREAVMQLIPLLLYWFTLATMGWFIAKRKGIAIGWIVFWSLPIFLGFAVFWWASRSDKAVLDRLAALEAKCSTT